MSEHYDNREHLRKINQVLSNPLMFWDESKIKKELKNLSKTETLTNDREEAQIQEYKILIEEALETSNNGRLRIEYRLMLKECERLIANYSKKPSRLASLPIQSLSYTGKAIEIVKVFKMLQKNHSHKKQPFLDNTNEQIAVFLSQAFNLDYSLCINYLDNPQKMAKTKNITL